MQDMAKKFRWGTLAGLTCLAASGFGLGCNSHPVQLAQATGAVSVHEDRSPDAAAAVDILWVIDNSGTMCEEQSALRENFEDFIDQITSRNIDFHIGVTTTHYPQLDEGQNYTFEPVALPGHLQSEPQPLPTSFGNCAGDEGTAGDQTDGYTRIREAIDVAVQCTKNPSEWQSLTSVNDDDITCALNGACGAPEDLFPQYENGESPYRDIPKVLRAAAYDLNDNEKLDPAELDNLRADFACASFVGLRGYPMEKGLNAAVDAVSPEKTGGSFENPTDPDAPNAGFIRENANFALIFVTDENDCSHDGSLPERSLCGSNICNVANNPDIEDSTPLYAPAQLADDFVANLSKSKGMSGEGDDVFNRDAIVVTSIHGRWNRYGVNYPDGQALTVQDCAEAESAPDTALLEDDPPPCSTSFGTAFSGDRYEAFLRQFNSDRVFPELPDESTGAHAPGLICQPDEISGTLAQIGETIAGSVSECIFTPPNECAGSGDSASCPAFRYGTGTAACTEFGSQSGRYYCDSGVQLRLYPSEDSDKTFADLEGNPYCIPDSIDSSATPGGCVVSRDRYSFEPCAGAESQGIELVWDSGSEPAVDLAGYDVELVYTVLPEPEDDGSTN